MLVFGARNEMLKKMKNLDLVSSICYLILFQKKTREIVILALINSENQFNVINYAHTAKLVFQV